MEKKKSKSSAKKNTAKKVVVENVAEEKTIQKEVVKEQSKKTSNHGLFKIVTITMLVAVVLTWLIPAGQYSGAEFEVAERVRTGINELFLGIFYGANYYLVQIMFLIVIGIFYGVISKTNGYNAMVSRIAKMWKGKEKAFILVNSLLIAVMASMFSHPFVTLLFIPMLYSVAKKLGMSKLSTIAMTFGSILVGLMGLTYSNYGVEYINSYMGTEASTYLTTRVGILAIGYLVLNIFNIMTMEKYAKGEVVEEMFITEDNNKKGIGYFILFGIIFVIALLGFINWETIFNTTVFTDFNTWLTTEVVISEHPIFSYILGNIVPFGSWDITNLMAVLMIVLIIVKFASRVKLDTLLDNALDGIQIMVKPIILMTLAYSVFVICYWSGMTATIINWINTLTSGFNPYLNAIGNVVTTTLHVDFGFTGFMLGSYYAGMFADEVNKILVIMTSMNGLVSFVAPTSVIMLVGLSLSNATYKDWFKYIWKFVVAMLIILFVLFTII